MVGVAAVRRRLLIAAGLSLGVHVAVLIALAAATPTPSNPPTPVLLVSLVPPPPIAAKPPPLTPAAVGTPRAPSAAPAAAPRMPTPTPTVLPPAAAAPAAGLTGADLAGAAIAGEAGGGEGGGGAGAGGACDMAARVQAALRADVLVRQALAGGGPPLRVWDGDWVRDPRQDGKGLAAVREAILWAVGFAPAPCRAQPMHGLVLMSLDRAPGAQRLVLGAPAWRWSDLLAAR